MSDVSIFGERSGSTPHRAASAPVTARRTPAQGLFGTALPASDPAPNGKPPRAPLPKSLP